METIIGFTKFAATVVILLIAAKAITIGSDFSFHYWIKFGKQYTDWYFNRETWEKYLREIIK